MQSERSPREWRFLSRVAERRAKKGLPPPASLESLPTLTDDERWIWRAFNDLASSRQSGFSPCPISTDSVLAWCRMNRVASWRQPMLWRIVHALDLEWLSMRSKSDDDAAPSD